MSIFDGESFAVTTRRQWLASMWVLLVRRRWSGSIWEFICSPLTITVNEQAQRGIQRDIGGTSADVTISGTYSGVDPVAIKAKFIGYYDGLDKTDWQTIDSNPSGGSYSGTFTGCPQGGWYKIVVTSTVYDSVTATTSNKFGVGIFIVYWGQSNSELQYVYGHESWGGDDYTANDLLALRPFYDSGTGMADEWQTPIANGCVLLGNALVAEYGIPIFFIGDAVGGSSLVEAYSSNGAFWDGAGGYLSTALSNLLSITSSFEYMVWMQGESDALNACPQATYYSNFIIFLATVRSTLGSDWKMLDCLIDNKTAYHTGIRAAISQVIANDDDVYLGAETDDLTYVSNDLIPSSSAILGQRIASALISLIG